MNDDIFDSFEVQYTRHGTWRASQRGIKAESIEAALLYGRVLRSGSAWVYRLDRRRVRLLLCKGKDLRRHEGTIVVASANDRVVTTYRNRQAKRVRQ